MYKTKSTLKFRRYKNSKEYLMILTTKAFRIMNKLILLIIKYKKNNLMEDLILRDKEQIRISYKVQRHQDLLTKQEDLHKYHNLQTSLMETIKCSNKIHNCTNNSMFERVMVV